MKASHGCQGKKENLISVQLLLSYLHGLLPCLLNGMLNLSQESCQASPEFHKLYQDRSFNQSVTKIEI